MTIGKHLTDANSGGTSFGQSTTDLISFYAVTPVAQPSGAAQAAVSTAAIAAVVTTAITTAAGIYGFSTAAQGLDLATKINLLITQVAALTVLANKNRADQVTLGLIAGA